MKEEENYDKNTIKVLKDTASRQEQRAQEEKAAKYVRDIQRNLVDNTIAGLDSFLDKQESMTDNDKTEWKKNMMLIVAGSLVLNSGSRKKEIKQYFKGVLSDYDKLQGVK